MSAVSTVLLGRWCPIAVSPFGVDLEFCGLGLLSVAVTSTKKKKIKTDVSAITSNYETKLGGLLSSLVLLRSWSWPRGSSRPLLDGFRLRLAK